MSDNDELQELKDAIVRLHHATKRMGPNMEVLSLQISPEAGRELEHRVKLSPEMFLQSNGDPIKEEADGHTRYVEIMSVKVWWRLRGQTVLPGGNVIASY
jgi:hypothetical protein